LIAHPDSSLASDNWSKSKQEEGSSSSLLLSIGIAWNGSGCLHCLGLLDPDDVRRYLSSEEEQAAEAAIYGVPRAALGEAGPSVSPVNGAVASLAAIEFMVAVTGMAEPRRLINYAGHLLRVTTANAPESDCPYCKGIRGAGAAADVERYLKIPHLQAGRAPRR
jgi:hypothetical protein